MATPLEKKLATLKAARQLSVDLSGLGITDADAGDVAEFLRNDKYAVTVDLSHNELGNAGAAAVAEALTSNATLTDLNLSHNAISDRGLTALCEVAVTKQNLCRMDVVGNGFGRKGIVTACLMVLARGPTSPKLGYGIKWALAADALLLPKSFDLSNAPGNNTDEWFLYCLRSADKATRLRILRDYEWKNQQLRRTDELDEATMSRLQTAASLERVRTAASVKK